MSKFNVQIPTPIVRSSEFNANEFVLIGQLIRAYYYRKEKSLNLEIDHKRLMYFMSIKDQTTFNNMLKKLKENDIIGDYTSPLPRKGALEIVIKEQVIPELNKEGYFTQMPSNVLDKSIIDAVGYMGVRMLYYYKSYINAKANPTNQFCFVAEETAAYDLGITRKTIIKYNKILEKHKFIKIDKHRLEEMGYDHKMNVAFVKYNNHYTIRQDKIDKYWENARSILA